MEGADIVITITRRRNRCAGRSGWLRDPISMPPAAITGCAREIDEAAVLRSG